VWWVPPARSVVIGSLPQRALEQGDGMPRLIATHEVDDVAHWLASPKRAEVFASVATDLHTFVDSTRPNHVGLSADVADMSAFQAVMESEAGAEAMKYDGVRPETIAVYIES
jgi:hypothetical protein